MARKKNDITDDNYYMYMIDIGADIVKKILDGLGEKYVATFVPVPEPNILAYNLMTISLFLDTERPRLFVTYKLDQDRTVGLRCSDTELYNRVYDKLHMIIRDQDLPITIIGEPTRLPEFSLNRQYGSQDQENKYLRSFTQSMWTITPGPNTSKYTYFIENRDQWKDDIRKVNAKPEDITRYLADVENINSTYINISNPDYQSAFNDYKILYKNYFDRDLKEVEEWRQITIFIDVRHDFKAEQEEGQFHESKIEHFERVSQYIREWAVAHGKPVPLLN